MRRHAGLTFRTAVDGPTPPEPPPITDITISGDTGTLLAYAIASNPNERQFAPVGGTPPFTFSVYAGALIPGWHLGEDGSFYTNGDTEAVDVVTIEVLDSEGYWCRKEYSELYVLE